MKEDHAHARIAIDIVGDIGVLRTIEPLEQIPVSEIDRFRAQFPRLKVFLLQTTPISGSYRLRRLKHIAGENRTATFHKENGCMFYVDLATAYFSPRLSYEHLRIAEQIHESEHRLGRGELVVNMFAGIGAFSVMTCRRTKSTRVVSIDVNPNAIYQTVINTRLNSVSGRIQIVLGDAAYAARNLLRGKADRVIMPLPEKAFEYLDAALDCLKPDGGLVHYYDFVPARSGEDPIERAVARINQNGVSHGRRLSVRNSRVVRSVGPAWYQVALDIVAEKG